MTFALVLNFFLKIICSTFGEKIVRKLGLTRDLSTLGPAKTDDVFFVSTRLRQHHSAPPVLLDFQKAQTK